MPIFKLTESLSVAAQITPQDIPNLAEQGFTAVVCNRPDGEVPQTSQRRAGVVARAQLRRSYGFAR